MSNADFQALFSRISARYSDKEIAALLEDPVIIVSAPRAGSTLLFQLMARSADIWTIGSESHRIYAQFPHLPGPRNFTGDGRLYAEHADETTLVRMRLYYLALLQNKSGLPLWDTLENGLTRFVFLEKTPRNSLNIKFLLCVFPKARFVFLWRDAKENIASLMEGWRIGAQGRRFVTYRNLPDWPLGYWCFILPPGWEAMKEKSLAEIAAFQWRACNDIALDDLSELPQERWITLSYDELVRDSKAALKRACDFCRAKPGEFLAAWESGNLPLSSSTVSPPRGGKWRDHEAEITAVLPRVQGTVDRISGLA